MNECIDDLINRLPVRILIGNIYYDLIIFLYRNDVRYVHLKSYGARVSFRHTLVSFYDGALIDNIKKMIDYVSKGEF